jgi:cytochrome c peroxidase
MSAVAIWVALGWASIASADPPIAPPDPMPARVLRGLALNPRGYDPGRVESAGPLLLGDLLFHSPAILGSRAQALEISCQTCHPNGAAHGGLEIAGVSTGPGNVDLSTAVFHAAADDGVSNPVDIPSLRGVRYTAPYGRDGRTSSMAELVRTVVVDEFGGEELPPPYLAALVRYLNDLDFVPNRLLDRTNRLTNEAPELARRGERLFAAPREAFEGRSCASCHVPSAFFADGRTHRHASGRRASPRSLDDGIETPTLLGTAETAPYFHDGRLPTLDHVVAFYDEAFALELSSEDRAALVAYLAAVGAIDLDRDDRPLGFWLVDRIAYLNLAIAGPYANDRRVVTMAIDAVLDALAEPERPRSIRRRVETADRELRALRARSLREPLDTLRPTLEALATGLRTLAADWTAAGTATNTSARPR